MILKTDDFARACRETDDISLEPNAIEILCNALNIDQNALIYVAQQRALRLVLHLRNEAPIPHQPISMTPEEEQLYNKFSATWIDAALISLKAYQNTHIDGQHKNKI